MWFRKGGSHVKKSVYGLEDKAKVVHLMLKRFFRKNFIQIKWLSYVL